jgi:hypothetical protein
LTNFILPRKIEGGQSVVIIAAGGDSLEERDGNEVMFEGSMRVLDMILSDIEASNGKASLIRTKADIPTRPNSGKMQFFLDIEGGGSIQANPEPTFSPDRSLALLRQFFRLGSVFCNSLQWAQPARRGVGLTAGRYPFGAPSSRNRQMMIGVSHLS